MQHDQSQEAQELGSALGETPQERQAAATSQELAKNYAPNQVPWLNDQYTYADRVQELQLMRNLLSFRMQAVQAELAQVEECCRARNYPNIAFQSEDKG
jgi:hypothetical protein